MSTGRSSNIQFRSKLAGLGFISMMAIMGSLYFLNIASLGFVFIIGGLVGFSVGILILPAKYRRGVILCFVIWALMITSMGQPFMFGVLVGYVLSGLIAILAMLLVWTQIENPFYRPNSLLSRLLDRIPTWNDKGYAGDNLALLLEETAINIYSEHDAAAMAAQLHVELEKDASRNLREVVESSTDQERLFWEAVLDHFESKSQLGNLLPLEHAAVHWYPLNRA